jgi:hypothetical protein
MWTAESGRSSGVGDAPTAEELTRAEERLVDRFTGSATTSTRAFMRG